MSGSLVNLEHAYSNISRLNPKSGPLVSQRGLSYLEMMIIVAVVGIVTVLAIPVANRSLELRRLDAAATNLASRLNEARINAIKRNRQAWLRIDPTNRTIQLQTTDNSGTTINVGPSQTLDQGVTFASPTAVAQVRFDSLGRLPTGTTSWTLTLQGVQSTKRKNVTISVTGTVGVASMTAYSQ